MQRSVTQYIGIIQETDNLGQLIAQSTLQVIYENTPQYPPLAPGHAHAIHPIPSYGYDSSNQRREHYQ